MRVASPGKQGARHEVLARPFVKLRLNKPRHYIKKRLGGGFGAENPLKARPGELDADELFAV